MSKALEDQNVLTPGFGNLHISEASYQEGMKMTLEEIKISKLTSLAWFSAW